MKSRQYAFRYRDTGRASYKGQERQEISVHSLNREGWAVGVLRICVERSAQ